MDREFDKMYRIRLKRESDRYDFEGRKSKLFHNEVLGEKNRFIGEGFEQQLSLATSFCNSIGECFDKLEEITNIVLSKLHNKNEVIWPIGKMYIDFCFKNEYFNEIKEYIPDISNNPDDVYLKIKKAFKKNSMLIESFKNSSIEFITENDSKYLRIVLPEINPFERTGIDKNFIQLLVSFIFNCLTGDNVEVFNDNCVRPNVSISYKEILQLALKYSNAGYDSRYCLTTCPNIISETVALIKDALEIGIDYNIINKKKGIVEFINSAGCKKYVVDGNETDMDSYIFPVITDDKYLVKNILVENSLIVPSGELLRKDITEEKCRIIKKFENKQVVIKPRNTNYGTGISIFQDGATYGEIENAVEYAFNFDDDVLIENFVRGNEYRFLVIGESCVSVVYRRSASVVGDGISTIGELIDNKNKESWHYLTETPIQTDITVEEFLKNQGYTYDSIIEYGKRVYLRRNSNCSTGGESIDVTNNMPDKFKRIAEKAAKCFAAQISGIDIIINDFDNDDYSIIEINDTPGYTINEWPYEGEGRKVGVDILKLIGLI